MPRLSIDVDDRSLKRTIKKVDAAIEESVNDATETAMETAIEEGQAEITRRDAIWNERVLEGFQDPVHLGGGHWVVTNPVYHAAIVDKGARFDDYPDADALIPWVLDNLSDWHPLEDDDGGSDGSGTVESGGTSVSVSGGGESGPDWTSMESQSETVSDTTTSTATDDGGVDWSENDYITDEDDGDDGGVWDSGSVTGGGDGTGKSYRPSTFHTETNGEIGFPTATTVEMLNEVTVTNTEVVNPQQWAAYDVLHSDEQDALTANVTDDYGDAGTDVYDLLNSWKFDAWGDEAYTYENVVKQRYDVDADLRASDTADLLFESTADHEAALHTLSVASQEFLKENYDDDNDGYVTAYRAMPDEDTAELAANMLERPESAGDRWKFESTVVDNYSLSESVADSFSDGIDVETAVNIEHDVVTATDFINPQGEKNEQEIHVIGGTREYTLDDIEFVNTPAADVFMKDPAYFSTAELEDVKAVIDVMSAQDVLVTNEDSIRWLRDVADKWEREKGSTALHDTVDTIVADVDLSDDSDDSIDATSGWQTLSDKSDWLNLEPGDIVDTKFGVQQVTDVTSQGIYLGWKQDDPTAVVQPGTVTEYYSIRAVTGIPDSLDDWTHLGETDGEYIRPPETDAVVGIDLIETDTGHEIEEPIRVSEVPADYDPTYDEGATVKNPYWVEDMVGEVFYVRTADGDLKAMTLREKNGRYVFTSGDLSFDWWPPGDDKHVHREVTIAGIPDGSE